MEPTGKFGRYLVTAGYVSPEDLEAARAVQEELRFLRIGEILVQHKAIAFSTLVEALREYRSQCRLGQLLVLEGAITVMQLEEALERQAATGLLLGKILIDMHACTLDQVMQALTAQRRHLAVA